MAVQKQEYGESAQGHGDDQVEQKRNVMAHGIVRVEK